MKKICVLTVCLALSLFAAGCESKAKQDAATKAAEDAQAAQRMVQEGVAKMEAAAEETKAAAQDAAAAAQDAAAGLKDAAEEAANQAKEAAGQ